MQGQSRWAPHIFAAVIALLAWAGTVVLIEACLLFILFEWAGGKGNAASLVFAFGLGFPALPLVLSAAAPIGVFTHRRVIRMVDPQDGSDQADCG